MKITYVLTKFPKRTHTFLANQIDGLRAAGHDVSVVASFPPESKLDPIRGDELLTDTSYVIDSQRKIDALGHLARAALTDPKLLLIGATYAPDRKLGLLNRSYVRNADIDADVLHIHHSQNGHRWGLVPELSNVPTILSFYGSFASRKVGPRSQRFRRVIDSVDGITGLSDHMIGMLQDAGCPSEALHKQPLGIETNVFDSDPPVRTRDEPLRLLSVARFVRKKGLRYAIEAVSTLSSEFDIQYRIVGDGELREDLERLVTAEGIGDSVEFPGWMSPGEVAAELERCHVFVQPSVLSPGGKAEGTPTILLQAEAARRPVISTYHAGIPEIVPDEAGILVPERDSSALATAIETLARNEDEWHQRGVAGRSYVEENHTRDAVVSSLEALYSSVADESVT